MNDVENGLGVKRFSNLLKHDIKSIYETNKLTIEQRKKYIKTRAEINKKLKDGFHFMYSRSDITEKLMKNCRGVQRCKDGINKMEKENERQSFRALLEFKENDIYVSKEQSVLYKILKTFTTERIALKYNVLGYYIDLYFLEYKLAVERDEQRHINRNNETERQVAIERELNCQIIRINPDKENFDIFIEIGRTQNYITESIRRDTINDISNKLLSLEFKKDNKAKIKCLKSIA